MVHHWKKRFFMNVFVGVMTTLSFFFLTFSSNARENDLIATVQQIEASLDARVGIAVYDKETNQNWQYHADDRFPMSSTFKTLACAALLVRVDSDQEQLERIVVFDESELVAYSPVTEIHVGAPGMSLDDLCKATMSVSDNSAANFILEAIGGPQALTQFIRSIGDEITRLDRWETRLNEAVPDDERDTTTPNAMVMTLEQLVLGETLSLESRQKLENWLKGNEIGDDLFRAGVPCDWEIGDRTGAGGYGSRSIAAVLWPPQRKPVIATVYITETEASFDDRNAAISEIGGAIVATVMEQ